MKTKNQNNIWHYGYGFWKIFSDDWELIKVLEEHGLKKSCDYYYKNRKIGEDFLFKSEELKKIKDLVK